MSPAQIYFISAVGAVLLALVIELVRRHLLREKYTLVWVFTCAGLLSIPWLYDYYAAAGRLVGIIDPNSLFFFMSIMGLVLFSLQFSLAISTAYYQRKALIQQVALLENRVRQLEDGGPGDQTPSPPLS